MFVVLLFDVQVTDEALTAIASSCKLRHLVLRGCVGITDAGVLSFY
jgi:hypothetical protein